MTVRLTGIAKRAGCAAKQPPGLLFPLLAGLPKVSDPRVIVGSATADDAAVIALGGDRNLVLTTDFFTPIVDDPYEFGAIAAANALSDVYAMGGEPLAALNLVGFPSESLDAAVLGEILRGGADKAREAGIAIVGGHTIQSDEPIYGLAVTGLVEPRALVTNAGAGAGDALVLTKPIGTGVLTTAAKRDQDPSGAVRGAVAAMLTLNRGARDAMHDVGASAATDVTGFGLLGHLRNLALASGCAAVIRASAVPLLPRAREYVEAGIAPGGTHANARFLADFVRYEGDVDRATQLLLCDAQTSGGLLIAVAPDKTDALVRSLRAQGTLAADVVGSIERGTPGTIRVVR